MRESRSHSTPSTPHNQGQGSIGFSNARNEGHQISPQLINGSFPTTSSQYMAQPHSSNGPFAQTHVSTLNYHQPKEAQSFESTAG